MLKTQEIRQADVLEVISNLSSDEVFTPPKVVNEMLDLLPEEVWSDPSLRWLDPGTKTGVFLREITRRLMVGLEDEISDEQERLQHILKEMIFGIAITELTALMARRTLYCSKDASSERSIVEMPTSEGNIWFERTEHDFNSNGRCSECGASKDQIERGEDLENYAYGFIHSDGRKQIEEVMEMKFDVIVGNPPYHMSTGDDGQPARPIYHLFVRQAVELSPRFMSMIVPSRWMAGGLGLDSFRSEMLSDHRIRTLVDHKDASSLFPGVDIKGGVCFFLWDRKWRGACEVTTVQAGERIGPTARHLNEFDVLVRDERALSILRKVQQQSDSTFSDLVGAQRPFGLSTSFTNFSMKPKEGRIPLFKRGPVAWVERKILKVGLDLIDRWKVLIPKVGPGNSGGHVIPDVVLGQPITAEPPSACTQTYLVIGPFDSRRQAESATSYIRTRFLRFMVSLRKQTQDAAQGTYKWVPQQPWDREWTDEELYEKYGITKKEQAYIEEMIKEMPSE